MFATEVSHAVPVFCVVAIGGNLETCLRPVIQIPDCITQRRVDQDISSLALVERMSVAWLFHNGAVILPALLNSNGDGVPEFGFYIGFRDGHSIGQPLPDNPVFEARGYDRPAS